MTRGRHVIYRLTVKNVSQATARRVRLCDRLPSGVRLTNAYRVQERAGRRICWRIGTLHAGKVVHRLYAVRVTDATSRCGRITNVAVASAQGQPRRRARATVRLRCAPPVTG